jgi:hypothetical protein
MQNFGISAEISKFRWFCICIEEKIQKNYKFLEFQNLLTIEQAKVYKDNGESCISEKGF